MSPKKKKYTTYFLFVLISSFISIVIWIGTNIYSKFVSSTIDETLTIQTQPINATFDDKTISKLRTREVVVPLNRPDGASAAASTLDVTPTVSPSPTPEEFQDETFLSPTISPTPDASFITPTPTEEAGGGI